MITTSVSSRSASLGVLFMALLAAINFAIPLSARAQDTTPRLAAGPADQQAQAGPARVESRSFRRA